MTDDQALTRTLVFQLDIQSNNESLLHDDRGGCRGVFNPLISLPTARLESDTQLAVH